jgi:hypothetical protein
MKYFQDGAWPGRKQSPRVENLFQEAVTEAVMQLLEAKGLYQNVTINERFSATIPVDPRFDFRKEFAKRPLYLFSRGETELGGGLGSHTGGALGTPRDEMEVGCYLPNIHTYCSKCKAVKGFISLSASNVHLMSPYPIIGEDTEQVYHPLYQCAACRKELINFQILRRGFKLQLAGRSKPYRPPLDREWPADIQEIVSDAVVAVAESDIPAGFYHLRTAVEFYIKGILEIDISTKIDGNDLCDRYTARIDTRLKSGFPSVAKIYRELSEGLHTRSKDVGTFNGLLRELLDHLRAKKMFEDYPQPSGAS